MKWTDESDAALRRMWNNEELTATQIAPTFGPDVTRNMVIGRVHRLKLNQRSQPRSASRASTERRVAKRVRHNLPDNWREIIIETQLRKQTSHVAAARLGLSRRQTCKIAKDAGIPFPPSNGTSGTVNAGTAKERKSIRGVKQSPLRFGMSPDTMSYEDSRRENGAVTFLDRRPNQCAWPLGSSTDKVELFCGAPVATHSHFHWCAFHHSIGTVKTHAIPRHFVEAAE